jgi:Na+/H+ antiporter NhaD/arsenite permease-like protein
MKKIAGTITTIILGGIVEVSWNTFLKDRMPVTASQITNTTAVAGLFFTALINNKKVRITASKKITIRLSGRSVSIFMI